MTRAVGTDIVSVARFDHLIARGDRFLAKWFTEAEIERCTSMARPGQHLAARFAAKEAVLKTFGARWQGPPPWRHIEVRVDNAGLPSIVVSGPALEAAKQAGIDRFLVSLSHCADFATATAIAD